MKLKIKRIVIEEIKFSASRLYPREFFCFLRGEKNIIKEIVLIPKIFWGRGFSGFYFNFLPIDKSIIGTAHSHIYSNKPSKKDLSTFSKIGKYHIIIKYPYKTKDIKVYDNKGKILDFEII